MGVCDVSSLDSKYKLRTRNPGAVVGIKNSGEASKTIQATTKHCAVIK